MSMQKALVTGGSGFLGEALIRTLLQRQYKVIVLDVRPPRIKHKNLRFVETNLLASIPKNQNFKHPDVVFNLAGATIFGRWTPAKKRLIYETRVTGTRNLVTLWQDKDFCPKRLVSASAVGFYGDGKEDTLTEESAPGHTFLSMVARDWEQAAWEAVDLGVGVVLMRNGYILDPAGGMLRVILPYYRVGLGGSLGTGKQYFPWVSLQDAVLMYLTAASSDWPEGPANVVAPQMVRNQEFSEMLAAAISRPHIFSIPRWALCLRFGEFAAEMLVSEKVYSIRAQAQNFHFLHPQMAPFFRKNKDALRKS